MSAPKLTFQRKKACAIILYESHVMSAEDIKDRSRSPQHFNATLDELPNVLKLVKAKLMPTDSFDFDAFMADVQRLCSRHAATVQEIEHIASEAEQRRLAARAGKTEWDLLEIDWEVYHPNAPQILDDAFYWRLSDDFAPHGNDTGADLLELFTRWNRTHRKTSPLKFLEDLLSGWGIQLNPWNATDPEEVRQIAQQDPIELGLCDETAVALAFAVVKLRGVCPSDVAELALKALHRMKLDFLVDKLSPEVRAERIATIEKMRAKLASLGSATG